MADERGSRRGIGWAFEHPFVVQVVGGVAASVLGALLFSFWHSVGVPDRPAGQRAASLPPSPSSHRATSVRVLRKGECVNIVGVRSGDSASAGRVVSCSVRHDAEVFFTGDVWARSAAYPGNAVVVRDAERRCRRAFETYVGVRFTRSMFDDRYWFPSRESWDRDRDRQVVCVAYYDLPVNYSVAGTRS
ncbi:septum formation family protein [Actinomadura rayongensis]|uniref:Septum formation-related domain-containing protein n=1 Tax=Actinomadura rayongensis TaxID=1429076 RepID=A0A6I4VZ65_9ACTN|nr:septum formation family protein [Actinomadura rayongensis]MXQ63277.1 hypothetical protein [Actinomadura rayongensis]